jgi:mRNA interferase RelE/StbE
MSDGYQIVVSREVAKAMRRLPKTAQRAIVEAFVSLGEQPRAGKQLTAELAGIWSLRRGDYRILYRIDDRRRLVEIARVGHRRDVYERRP